MDLLDVRLLLVMLLFLEYSPNLSDAVQHVGYKAEWKQNMDHVKRAIILTDPKLTVKEDGVVVGWHVYTARQRRSQRAYLQIWRPNPDVSEVHKRKVYTLIGHTEFKALWAEAFYLRLYPEDRIPVKAGDITAVYFPKYNPIPWTENNCAGGNEHYFKYNPHKLAMNKTYYFERAPKDWRACRKYSYNATVMNGEEAEIYDTTYDESEVDAEYEKRLYGKYIPTRRPFSGAPTQLKNNPIVSFLTGLVLWLGSHIYYRHHP